ncbi:GTP-binding protein [Micromonospora sp. BRA006-A]|nr:GTP-binding protein [Micromonospora sp. BRA006-A]
MNLGIVAHVDAGKTSLTERLLYEAGAVAEPGSVDAGTTRTDSMELERRRGITIRAAVTSITIGDLSINLLDTPGHPDFIAEVERSLAVLDAAVLVVSSVEGVSRRQSPSGGRCAASAYRPCSSSTRSTAAAPTSTG